MENIKNKKKRALTLIEALIWLAIFSAVVAAVFGLYSKSKNSNHAMNTNRELSVIFVNISNAVASTKTGKIDNGLAYQLGMVPKTLKVSNDGDTINNQFGGSVTFMFLGLAANPDFGIVLYTRIPTGETCSSILKSQSKIGWTHVVTSNGNIVYDSSYTIKQIGEICKTNGSGTIDLQFNFNGTP